MANDAFFSEENESEKVRMSEDIEDQEPSEFPLTVRREYWTRPVVSIDEDPFLIASVEMRLRQKRAAGTFYYKNFGNISDRIVNPDMRIFSSTQGWFSHPLRMVDDLRKDDEAILRKKLLECFRSLVTISTVKESKDQGLETEKSRLEEEIAFLKDQLQSNNLAVRIYNIGAIGLLAAIFSFLVWNFTGVGAPLHPTFAILLVPVSLGLLLMAYLTRRDQDDEHVERKKNRSKR